MLSATTPCTHGTATIEARLTSSIHHVISRGDGVGLFRIQINTANLDTNDPVERLPRWIKDEMNIRDLWKAACRGLSKKQLTQ